MRKLLCILLLTSPLFAQTFSVSGHVVDPTTAVPGSTDVTFTLVGTGNQQCKVSGTGLIVPGFAKFTPNVSTGVISGTLYRNDFIVCGNQSNTQWQYIVKSGGNPQPACILAQVASSSLNLDNTACSNTTPVVVPPTGDNTYCRLDGSNCGFTGAISAGAGLSASSATISGKVTESNWNNVRIVDGTTLTTIQACINALPATGGTCLVPPNNVNGEYVENLTANIVLKKNTILQFLGQCQITQNGFIISIPQAADDVSIISPFVHSSDQGGNAQGCAFVGYTGSGAAIDIGSSVGFTYNTLIRGIQVNLFSAQAGAIAYRLTNEVQGSLDDDTCVEGPVSGQKCYATVGTGAFFAGLIRILSPECSAAPGATNNFCIQLGAITNDVTILGGHANILGSGANGSVCIDVSGATSGNNQLYGFDCDTGVTAVTIESTVNRGLYAVINTDSGVTNGANFGAGSLGNVVIINANLPVVDNGTAGTNTYKNPARSTEHTDVWQMEATTSFWLLTALGSGAYVPYAASIGGSNKLSSFTGSETDININSGCGLGLFNETVRVLTWDCNGTMHPAVVNAVGLGTAALPFKNLIIGSAATNNTTWTPVVTAARTLTSPDGNSSTVMPFNFTTTAATTDNVAVTGMTASGHCTLTPTNTAAAAGIASVFISAKAANQITVTHTATAAWTFDGVCTSN